MQKFGPPIGDADFWWKKYFCGLVMAPVFAGFGILSLASRHSYAPFDGQHRYIHFVSVYGPKAEAMGFAYLGVGLVLFGACYLQYNEKFCRLYEWIAAPGALMMIAGFLACSWFYLAP